VASEISAPSEIDLEALHSTPPNVALQVLPSKAGAGPLALYRALANEPPAAA